METHILIRFLFFLATLINLLFALILWFRGKTKATFHLGWVAFFSAIYNFTFLMIYLSSEPRSMLFWSRATWLGLLIIPELLTFVYYFTERTRNLKLKIFIWYFPAIIFSILALTTPYFSSEIISVRPPKEKAGPLANVGWGYVAISCSVALFYLIKDYFKSQGLKKVQIRYFIVGTSIYVGSGILFAGILPILNPMVFNEYVDLSGIFSVFWVGLSTFAIFQKSLFGIKLILTELLIGIMGVFLIILPFFMPTTLLKIFTIGFFFLFCLFSYLLIRYTYQEIRQKEILEEKVRERTRELEKSKEELEKAKEELEKAYNQVLSEKEKFERLYKATLGREVKMVELKKRIEELEKKLKEGTEMKSNS